MSLYEKLVRHVLYPVDRCRSGDARELRYLREFERTQFLPGAELRELQLRRLKALLDHAYAAMPLLPATVRCRRSESARCSHS